MVVGDGVMLVGVGVGFADRAVVRMQVVLVVKMEMVMHERLVPVDVAVLGAGQNIQPRAMSKAANEVGGRRAFPEEHDGEQEQGANDDEGGRITPVEKLRCFTREVVPPLEMLPPKILHTALARGT